MDTPSNIKNEILVTSDAESLMTSLKNEDKFAFVIAAAVILLSLMSLLALIGICICNR